MRNNWYKKSLVVGIIVLFICVTFASGISFKVDLSKTVQIDVSNNELVKVPISICRVDSVEDYEVSLTQQQVEELENLIDNIKPELDKVETLEETEELFRDTVSSMDELGILPDDMSVEEAQQLVTGDKYKLKPETCIRKRISQFLNAGLYNEYCYLYAKATNSGRMITYYFGETCEDLYGWYVDYYPAVGWVWTNGKMGKQVLEGSFKGDIRSIFTPPKTILVDCRGHVGTMGFWGFYLKLYSFFLGYTLVAKFVYWSP